MSHHFRQLSFEHALDADLRIEVLKGPFKVRLPQFELRRISNLSAHSDCVELGSDILRGSINLIRRVAWFWSSDLHGRPVRLDLKKATRTALLLRIADLAEGFLAMSRVQNLSCEQVLFRCVNETSVFIQALSEGASLDSWKYVLRKAKLHTEKEIQQLNEMKRSAPKRHRSWIERDLWNMRDCQHAICRHIVDDFPELAQETSELNRQMNRARDLANRTPSPSDLRYEDLVAGLPSERESFFRYERPHNFVHPNILGLRGVYFAPVGSFAHNQFEVCPSIDTFPKFDVFFVSVAVLDALHKMGASEPLLRAQSLRLDSALYEMHEQIRKLVLRAEEFYPT